MVGLLIGQIIPDLIPTIMQKRGSATLGFLRIAEVALQVLVIFRNSFALVRDHVIRLLTRSVPFCNSVCTAMGQVMAQVTELFAIFVNVCSSLISQNSL